ncbi:divisome protein SepX/GlpR [Mycobacterium parmense]|uniref:Uncharacterized protein n=1 Tax=Mycobacterium parmense TaxID=185642 RepID=A0A7I7Z251_9MYCO|nr:gephyrin-like molybdotransferase receptor GlpR [Mycobacterium parmense]MCV7352117.1 hypothetical protein [Mycobacterium parmense]ORW56111.1 hypothetical protein AWC20_15415 [Mycobacterium parmense]BBZ48166.1 hypothetical protein MPRM_54470 [Mycobacterium parmense]
MPSIPQSLLWISLVVLWLFVLVPMLISKRDAVRRTSDVALATRVLNSGGNSRLIKRTGPAAGHRSDPGWQAPEDTAEEDEPELDRDEGQVSAGYEADRDDDEDADRQDTEDLPRLRAVVDKVDAPEEIGPDYLDVDVVEDSKALPVGAAAEATGPVQVDRHDPAAADFDGYEYVEDSSGLEPEDDEQESDDAPFAAPAPRAASRRHRFDAQTAAAVSARKYVFRKRMLMAMAVVLVGSATAAFEVTPSAWWVCGTATAVTMLYLAYLRRQTRIEEKVRRRRMQRMARARLGVENAHDRDYDVVPSRLRRPGAVVLEIDDEDPVFEHLDYFVPARNYGWPRDLPRAVGQ